jgi:hypothetical protein
MMHQGLTSTMIDYCPVILIFVTASVWVYTALQSSRLIEAFWVRLPHVAAQELDSVVGRSIHNGVFPEPGRFYEETTSCGECDSASCCGQRYQ